MLLKLNYYLFCEINKYINSVQGKLTVQVDRRFAKLKPCIIHFREFVKLYVH